MVINEREFPVVVQAYQPTTTDELFVAEQLVRTQSEVDVFTKRYAGYLIKARVVRDDEMTVRHNYDTNRRMTTYRKGVPAWAIFLLIVIALAVVGFTTGWIQRNFDISM
jgi:hypothetical protein